MIEVKTDEELVRKIQQGEILAFEELVKRYQAKLFRYVAGIVVNENDAEEIVQDALFKVYRGIDHIQTDKKFSSYLFTIAKNTAISLLRSRKEEIPLDKIEEIMPDGTDLIEHVAQKHDEQKVREKVDLLSDKQRSVLKHYYYDNLSYGEISRKLKLPLNTVRTHLRRAKDRLGKLLQ